MSATVTPAAERVQLPHRLRFYDHQRAAIQAFQDGAQRAIWRWHRQGGKGTGALGWTGMAAFERPGTYLLASPTKELCRENFWDARDPDSGERYMDLVFPPALVVDTNENELALEIRTRVPGQTSRIVFRSADDPDRLRGPAYAGCVLDEFATMVGREPLDVVRIPVERANGWLLITSTPRGTTNHFAALWRAVEHDPAWWCDLKTIEDTHRFDGSPIIPVSVVEQEAKEGVERAWLDQEFYVRFASATTGSYFGELLDRMEAEHRVGEFPWQPSTPVTVAFDIGMADWTVVTFWQDQGEYRTLLDERAFQGVHLAEILARVRSTAYNITSWLGPHDLEVRDFSATAGPTGETVTRRQVAARLGVHFVVVPRLEHPEYHDAIRRLMASKLRIHRTTCPRTLEALASYGRDWDGKLKVYKDRPRHDEHSHFVDSVKTYAVGYRPPIDAIRTRETQYARTSLTHERPNNPGPRKARGSLSDWP